MGIKRLLLSGIVFLFWSTAITSLAQSTDYERDFRNAKLLLTEGKFPLAMESFKKLIPYDKSNPYSTYASFYYALSAYKQGYIPLAKDQFNEIIKLYPQWDKIDEVNYWLAVIAFDGNDPESGIRTLLTIRNKELQVLGLQLKESALTHVNDLQKLKVLYQKFPDDATIGKPLANLLVGTSNPDDKQLLEALVKEYRLDRDKYIQKSTNNTKDRYVVSAVFPFMAATLEPVAGKKRNQQVLDVFEGMKLAVDSLKKLGITIELRAYDTERDPKKLVSLLETGDLLPSDVIIGPFFTEESVPLYQYTGRHSIPVFNIFLSNAEMLPGVFNIVPSADRLGETAANTIHKNLKHPSTIVVYGPGKRDSLMAMSYIATMQRHKIRVRNTLRIIRENSKVITSILATPTDHDEFNYPSQFTLPKDSLGGIFVATDDPLIFSKVLSAVETRKDEVPVMGLESWLDQSIVDLNKFQTLPVYLISPNTRYAVDEKLFERFIQSYVNRYGRIPTQQASQGFELLFSLGKIMQEKGTGFPEFLNSNVVPGHLTSGWDFRKGNSNQQIPVVKFQEGKFRVID